jgi:hypothetical protein
MPIALIAVVVAVVAILALDGAAQWTGLAVAGGLGVAAGLSFGAQPRDPRENDATRGPDGPPAR